MIEIHENLFMMDVPKIHSNLYRLLWKINTPPITCKNYNPVHITFANDNVIENDIEIVKGNMIDYCAQLYHSNSDPSEKLAILNFANNSSPGLFTIDPVSHGHIFTTNTQEEQILRSTLDINNQIIIPLDNYPITPPFSPNERFSSLLSERVLFWRDPRTGEPFNPLEQSNRIFVADIITCAALEDPPLNKDGKDYLHRADQDMMVERMIHVMNVANQSTTFVVGLWGCGAFGHPASQSLRLWKEAWDLIDVKFKPKKLVFCYMEDGLTNLGID